VNFKKAVAPVIVSLFLSGYFVSIGIAFYKFNIPNSIKITVIVASVIVTAVIIGVLIDRLKEIKVIVSLFLSGYFVSIGIAFYKFNIPNSIKLMVIVASVIVTAVIIGVLIDRLKEIKGGEEDDLGKY